MTADDAVAGRRKAPGPPAAIVVSIAVLVALLGGTAIAGTEAITSGLTKAKVRQIAGKQITRRAPGLAVASAADADALQGNPASAFASATSEPYHLIGAPGEPAFQNGWVNHPGGSSSTGYNSDAGFYKDPLGVVHLKGTISNGVSGVVAFTLPAAYRPEERLYMPAASLGPEAANVLIEPNGDVAVSCEVGCQLAGIDGLTYRVP